MILCTVYVASPCLARHVLHVEGVRTAQITARRLAKRFPGTSFGFTAEADFYRGDGTPAFRDAARSVEVRNLVAAELVLERAANPTDLPKWCVFQYRDGGVIAWPDENREAVERCRDDWDIVREWAIYVERPTPVQLLDCFRGTADAT